MPRDSSGNMTLVTGNPVVSGTAISSTVMNNTLADLAAEIEDSLSRSGKGGMLVALEFAKGTAALPGITFANDTNTGVNSVNANEVSLIAGGVETLKATTTGVGITGSILVSGNANITGALDLGGVLTFTNRIDPGNLPLPNYDLSTTSTSNFSESAGSWSNVTNAVITDFATNGNPVMLMLVPDGTSSTSFVGIEGDTSNAKTYISAHLRWSRSGTSSATPHAGWIEAGGASSTRLANSVPPGAISCIDVVGAGTYTYQLQYLLDDTQAIFHCEYVKVFAKELV